MRKKGERVRFFAFQDVTIFFVAGFWTSIKHRKKRRERAFFLHFNTSQFFFRWAAFRTAQRMCYKVLHYYTFCEILKKYWCNNGITPLVTATVMCHSSPETLLVWVTRSGSAKCSGSTLCQHWPFFDGGHKDLELNRGRLQILLWKSLTQDSAAKRPSSIRKDQWKAFSIIVCCLLLM